MGALDVLVKDLKVFELSNPDLYREMTVLLTMDDFRLELFLMQILEFFYIKSTGNECEINYFNRKHHLLSSYGNVAFARKRLIDEIKVVIAANPQFAGKLEIPPFEKSRLRRLINQR